ncbi:cystathionine beta-lyase family protein involved in aluminum resistance [Salsuginibacillus halophilus]|uniref:Cystathionine beta-lyase family protein involved in aluminum resistance n=1 Tax=Salsuginibacillus halophilus TaxID=517424 RepID=A0A2P8HYJ5_9BACI|nr:methionine gamma-lyase family protein [Salsuginibacillus halophilus]PSL51283.1 cystathionine beta-lyase family protein involved in aluminum resistance [Salsuginibacillus halophilus]
MAERQIGDIIKQAEAKIRPRISEVEATAEQNQARVLEAFRQNHVSSFHLQGTTGYGYDDSGRDVLEAVYAELFGHATALVRPQLISGTHAIAAALFGLMRPGDELIYASGTPYDTLQTVLGLTGDEPGNFSSLGLKVKVIPLKSDGSMDLEAVKGAITKKTKVIAFQRSRGYEDRPSFPIQEIAEAVSILRPYTSAYMFVDNCYGEFVETKEPGHAGADICAGSLIKNPGGGLVRTGGYITGSEEAVAQAASRLAAPGIGSEGGATLNMLQEMYQGLFLAPHVVQESLKGALFTAALLEEVGFDTTPNWQEARTDLIQAVHFHNRQAMITFCQEVQRQSPVDANVTPEPSAMPGYEDEVIMAAGTFIQGASIELTADGPLRPPYTAFVQGGLMYAHVKLAVIAAVEKLHQITKE